MGRKLQISIVGAVVALIGGALLLYWWDSAHENEIAAGVKVGSVDVGGMEADDARRQLQASLIKPLQKNVIVTYRDQKFKLKPEELGIRADIAGMVDEALAASREGSILARSWRRLGGGEVDHRVEPQIRYSKSTVEEFIAGVAENVNREPQDASVEPSGAKLEPVPARKGLSVEQQKLKRGVEKALQSAGNRKVKAAVEKVDPEVTTDQLAAKYPTYLVVDRSSFELRLYKNLKLAKTYTVAIGKIGHDTPSGVYNIDSKQVDPTWNVPDSDWAGELAGRTIPPGPDNPLKERWMGFYNGAGIHGTSDTGSLGSAASHGCVRMDIPDVVDLYDRVEIGTPIYIA
jgi:lipoprotein-anchoring transpeptidase ErfK/SrfK